jgi:CRISPR-associated endonuclease/helicase Cas3
MPAGGGTAVNSSTQQVSFSQVKGWLPGALGLSVTDSPFPWQEELLSRFSQGQLEAVVDIPTGLGKTAVMAIWLLARASGAALPRRLVYVVDRRAVVDQATETAVKLREYVERTSELGSALGLGDRSLPISTLRGQHVDNREWLEDPASPAIIVGTVDMIGSRLLFEGYSVSRKMRPYHAGLLGSDTLIVLDEAHLVPPFERLLDTIAGAAHFGPREEAAREGLPPFHLMSLSATGRPSNNRTFGLTDQDLKPGSIARKRLDAAKRMEFVSLSPNVRLPEELADRAWHLADSGKRPIGCVVYCDKREDAIAAKAALEKLAKGAKSNASTELLVGARRVFERQGAAERLKELGFLAVQDVQREQPAFLFATSAGEVGVDLDADHMASDLVAWERMVQRLGRVNRLGEGNATVAVVIDSDAKRPDEERKMLAACERVLRRLPPFEDGALDASPGAIRDLRQKADTESDLGKALDAATTPAPLRPTLTRAVVDAWSMTSLKEHSGRPDIGPWLRGWLPNDPPQTTVVWRKYLPAREGSTDREIEEFFEAAPPHMSELLEAETRRVVKWLNTRSKALVGARRDAVHGSQDLEAAEPRSLSEGDVSAIVLSAAGDLVRRLSLSDLSDDKMLQQTLPGATLVIDARIAGLKDGLLDDKTEDIPRTADDGQEWFPDADGAPVIRFRVRPGSAEVLDGDQAIDSSQWRERVRFVTEVSEEGQGTQWLVVYKWRHDGATEDDRSTGSPQLLDAHQECAEKRARDLAHQLELPEQYAEMLALAARMHDEGKAVPRWQRAAKAPGDGIYGKTRGPMNPALLDGYRHELGSLLSVRGDSRLASLSVDLKDLALHLITAHHGSGRPTIRLDGCDEAPPSVLREQAGEIALRFARLQKQWGPWGLAWWEALLRAADQQASRENETGGETQNQETMDG